MSYFDKVSLYDWTGEEGCASWTMVKNYGNAALKKPSLNFCKG